MSHSNAASLPECYKILNVSPGVNWAEVKKSYHTLAFKFHPDHHPGVERYENRFKEISRAFKALESHYQSYRIQECKYSFEKNTEDLPSDKTCVVDIEIPSPNQQSFFKSIFGRRVDKELVINLKRLLLKLERILFYLN